MKETSKYKQKGPVEIPRANNEERGPGTFDIHMTNSRQEG